MLGKTDVAADLIRVSNIRFAKKDQLDSLWQCLAEEFHPFRADITTTRTDGDEYAKDLYESTPCQYRRDLAYAMGALTRPDDRSWFDYKAQEDKRNTEAAKAWLARQRDKQRTLLYNRNSNWQVAMHQGDNDFVTFGNAVHSHTEDVRRNKLIVYDTHHIRDCAWAEDRSRNVNEMHRKFKITLANWSLWFPDVPLPETYKNIADRDKHYEIEIRHICFPNDRYDFYKSPVKNKRLRFSSVYVDANQGMILLEGGYYWFPYTVRRWVLDDNSPYAHSPAAMLGLIDGRLLQSETRVILEAGERVVDPPMLARSEGVLGRVNNYPGYTNWIEANYDERQGEALRPLETKGNLPLGLEMRQDTRQVLAAAWMINKLTLPPEKDMTAFEVNERISEYIRSIGPAVKPFEADNAKLLDVSFNMNLQFGNFGPPQSIPPELRSAEIVYEFDGPIQMAYKRQSFQKARETADYAGSIVKATGKQEVLDNFDLDQLARDGAEAIGGANAWIKPAEAVAQLRQARQAQDQQLKDAQKGAQALQTGHGMADLAAKLPLANRSIAELGKQQQAAAANSPSSPYPEEEGALATGALAA